MGFWSNLGNAVMTFAAKTLGVLADCAEVVVGAVKDVWRTVKPYVESHLQPLLKIIHDRFVSSEWARSAIRAFYHVLEWVKNFADTRLARDIDRAIQWAIDAARRFRDWVLNPKEMAEGAEHKQTLDSLPALPPPQQRAAQHASFITNFLLVKAWLAEAVKDDKIKSLRHYLRLRAIQKLLIDSDATIEAIESIEDISEEDMFLLEVSARLMEEDPILSKTDADKLDRLLLVRFGKTLLPFVFEEMIIAWGKSVEARKIQEASVRDVIKTATVLQRVHDISSRLASTAPGGTGGLSAEELQQAADMARKLLAAVKEMVSPSVVRELAFEGLKASLAASNSYLKEFHERTVDIGMCVDAAEGFLQYLEDPEKFARTVHLSDPIEEIGRIIVECAQFNQPLSRLSAEQLELIHDFAVIFHQDGVKRSGQMIIVPVGP
jgi:hypothetical protein